ncbi:LysE family translocator [Marinomonas mediterranea]|jgi:Putative threonine efflux protein|uniref:Lysine exporter protein (LYSE/YGGA) n=1 Tax=Marinomonas mediterranea (strain ATCC 700492 / JCM 21426 / NBRC 103028 / MMB-1) TaxID=717774 RepID=F2JYI6_MARM1|nr:LysE family translocator [Marinomonas mediterranea]ADZ93115.1 Lysine exporter protein (LYSE/YGGA) [Marinomonas mediterranea MMB-1]WCN19124.1 LysE family transporter [Marinomonas mediterranea MMB-1]
MFNLSIELFSVVVITLLAVISPGPDFVLITKLAISNGRRAGIICSLGIGAGISVHLLYTLVGVGMLLSEQVWLLNTMKILGAGYLLWLGGSALWPDLRKIMKWCRSHLGERNSDERSSINPVISNASQPLELKTQKGLKASFMSGFICNALNPKTMLFIVALFSQVISLETSIGVQLVYGVYIAIAHIIWFSLVACLFTTSAIQSRIQNAKRWLERLSGGVMFLFGVKLMSQ